MLGVPDGDNGMNLFDELLFFVIIEVHVPLRQPRLSGPVLDEDESNLIIFSRRVVNANEYNLVVVISYTISLLKENFWKLSNDERNTSPKIRRLPHRKKIDRCWLPSSGGCSVLQ